MDWIKLVDSLHFPISLAMLIVGVGAWVVAIIAIFKAALATKVGKKRFYIAIFIAASILFCIVVNGLFIATQIVENGARREIATTLKSKILLVQVNGKILRNPEQLINDISQINNSDFMYHHSHPTDRVDILLKTSDGDLNLRLFRDSGLNNEYWVYYPKYRTSTIDNIGKISTASLDGY